MDGLAALLTEAARSAPERTAVVVPNGATITYGELGLLSDDVRDRLWHLGVRPGDRVGLRLPKSIDALATIFGILKAGAAYVPVDAASPLPRGAFILKDCDVRLVVTEQETEAALLDELAALGARPGVLAFDEGPLGGLRPVLADLQSVDPAPRVETVSSGPDAIAYILYTSGSTGNPKGVTLSHRNAMSFIDWCSATFEPTEVDVFSSHAPFHFDLSILDIFLPIKHGSTLVLIGEDLGKDPRKLAALIASTRISVWYSTPSVLTLLASFGKLERHDYLALRLVLFAGEVFPIPRFKTLHARWPDPRYFNLYGPTETNVCTFYEVPTDESWDAMDTFPIGSVCPPNSARLAGTEDREVARGQIGELLVTGPNVMEGYWNLPGRNDRVFLVDGDEVRWYRTGDLVREDESGQLIYAGRQDRMVKRRGYRVELGEIEAGLIRHADIHEVAVVAVSDAESGVRIGAFLRPADGRNLTIIELKKLSIEALPAYMVPDAFTVMKALPRTSTDKVDYEALKARG